VLAESPPPPPPPLLRRMPPRGTSPPPPPAVHEPAVGEAEDWQADWGSDQEEGGEAVEKDWMAEFVDDYNTQVGNRGRTGPAMVRLLPRRDSRQQGETVGETVGETGGGPEDEQKANEKLAGVSKSFAKVARELGINSMNQQACSPECQHESSW